MRPTPPNFCFRQIGGEPADLCFSHFHGVGAGGSGVTFISKVEG